MSVLGPLVKPKVAPVVEEWKFLPGSKTVQKSSTTGKLRTLIKENFVAAFPPPVRVSEEVALKKLEKFMEEELGYVKGRPAPYIMPSRFLKVDELATKLKAAERPLRPLCECVSCTALRNDRYKLSGNPSTAPEMGGQNLEMKK